MAVRVDSLARIVLQAADPNSLAAFYRDALGFMPNGSARGVSLSLGGTRLDIRRAEGRPYPDSVPGWSPLFQHCAIAVSDMAAAMAQLARFSGWRAISVGGPQKLPANTGGVTAFKFRDPEGHPLEFLAFPRQAADSALFLRIDHSAISVADTEASVRFYGDLGLTRTSQSLNRGGEQASLDDIAGAEVAVTSLMPPASPPHVELLCYRGRFDRRGPPAGYDDVASTRLVFAARAAAPALMRDPDGHIIEIAAV